MGKPNIIRHRERPLALLPIRGPAVSLPRERHRHRGNPNQLRSQSLSDSLHEPVPLSYKPALPAFSLSSLCLFLRPPCVKSFSSLFVFALPDVSCQLSASLLLSAFCLPRT